MYKYVKYACRLILCNSPYQCIFLLRMNMVYIFSNNIFRITYLQLSQIMLLQMSPLEAERSLENQKKIRFFQEKRYSKFTKKKPKYKKDQIVRIKLEHPTFSKGFRETFSEELFKIHKVSTKWPIPMYTIKSLDNAEKLIGKFYEFELCRAKQELYRIKEIIKRRGTKLFVSWQDYPERYNSWIDKKDIQKY